MIDDISPLLDYFLYRPQHPNFDRQFSSGEWVQTIDHLMAAGYNFKAEKFNEEGFLFRGVSTGFLEALKAREFGFFPNTSETNLAEQILQIYFITHDLSDAITASSLYNEGQDSAVLIFKASLFNQALVQRESAIMEVGDMGVIFRYPFLTQPLMLDSLAYILINDDNREQANQHAPEFSDKLLSVATGDHSRVLADAKNILSSHAIMPATPQSSDIFPCMKHYKIK
jgi:hypothetical protein